MDHPTKQRYSGILDIGICENDDEEENFESEYFTPHRMTHTSGPCKSSVERELQWFLERRLPDAIDDLKDILEMSIKCSNGEIDSSRNTLTPVSLGSGNLSGSISFNGLSIDHMDLIFCSKQYMNGHKIPIKVDLNPGYDIAEMKFAGSCVAKCIRACGDILSRCLSGKRHLTEKLNIVITNLRLAISILDMNVEGPTNLERTRLIPGLPRELNMMAYVNEDGELVITISVVHIPGQESPRPGQRKSAQTKTKSMKSSQPNSQGVVVLAEDKLVFKCQNLDTFFGTLRIAEAHAVNFLNKLMLLYDV